MTLMKPATIEITQKKNIDGIAHICLFNCACNKK